jgi:hypothetical protein
MLRIEPMRWFSWDFTVDRDGRRVAELDISWWRERGELAIDGARYAIARQGLVSGDFRLTAPDGRMVATASKPSREAGAVTPAGAWSRRASATLPDALPLPVQVFVVWLAVLLWKRDDDAASAAS